MPDPGTNSSAFMLAAVLLVVGLFIVAMRSRLLVPTRLQSIAEITYDFVET